MAKISVCWVSSLMEAEARWWWWLFLDDGGVWGIRATIWWLVLLGDAIFRQLWLTGVGDGMSGYDGEDLR